MKIKLRNYGLQKGEKWLKPTGKIIGGIKIKGKIMGGERVYKSSKGQEFFIKGNQIIFLKGAKKF